MVTGTVIQTGDQVVGIVSGSQSVFASVSPARQEVVGILASGFTPYSGENVITPTESEQILNTSGKSMSVDVIINPIPDNYARMSWDGTILHFY